MPKNIVELKGIQEVTRNTRLFNYFPGLLYIKDKKRRYVWANDNFISFLGYSNVGEIYQKSDDDVFKKVAHADALKRIKEMDDYTLSGKGDIKVYEYFTDTQGQKHHFITHKRLFEGDKKVLIVGNSIDITDLINENEIVSDLAAFCNSLSHNIKSPLSKCSMRLDKIAAKLNTQTDTDMLSYVASAQELILEAADMTDHRIALLASGGDHAPENCQKFTVKRLIRDALKRGIPGSFDNVTIEQELDENFMINGNLQDLTLATHHLIDNAKDAVEEYDHTILISSRKTEQYKELLFVNPAPDLDAMRLAHLFDRGFTTKPKSLGIGLTYVRKVARQHKGELICHYNQASKEICFGLRFKR